MMTPHINAKLEDIASVVLMPGDPLRAKKMADDYLENVKLVNTVRNILAYTGTYKGKEVTVMASGMGIPSMGIYSYELYNFYNVDTIIRIGSCGSYTKNLNLYDLLLVDSSYSTSSYALHQNGCEDNVLYPTSELNEKIAKTAEKLNLHLSKGKVYCSEVFYSDIDNFQVLNKDYNCVASEMETFSLFHNANTLGKKAACILTVSDSLVTEEKISSEQRQTALNEMLFLALESIL